MRFASAPGFAAAVLRLGWPTPGRRSAADLVHRSRGRVLEDIHLAGAILGERAHLETCRRDLRLRDDAATQVAKTPQAAAAVVRIEIDAAEVGGGAVMHESTGDGAAQAVLVLDDRRRQAGRVAARRVVAVHGFHHVPAEVGALRHEVDLLIRVLANVSEPERSRLRVEREAPGIAQPVRPDFATPATSRERVVGWDAIARAVAHVDSQELREERVAVLPVALRVPARASVAHPDVEISVRPERELPAVVIFERLPDLEDDDLACFVRDRAVRREARDLSAQWATARVVEEEDSAPVEVRRERDAEEPLLASGLH